MLLKKPIEIDHIFIVFFTTNSWLITEGLCCIVEFDITSAPMQYNLYTDVVFLLFSKNIGELAIKARTRASTERHPAFAGGQ